MDNSFSFNEDKYDFSSILSTIEKHYYLEKGEEEDDALLADEKAHNLECLIYDSVFNPKNYKLKWGEFEKHLRQEFGKKIHLLAYRNDPSFQGYISLSNQKGKNFRWTKELRFYISLLGPYYTIFGLDMTQITLERASTWGEPEGVKCQTFSSFQAITVSPEFEYRETFLLLKQKIAGWFPDYKFVPYEINREQIAGVKVDPDRIDDRIKSSVHNALFGSLIDIEIPIRGDVEYGYHEWLREKVPSEEELENVKLLEVHLSQNRTEGNLSTTSLYKVWKFKALSELPDSSQKNFGGMISFPSFEILDFTDT
ncbi:hypothetical protein GU926_08930 [Nibribacter ruber]|uniref:Uncharacterized protein n=1 Tax=Nibribacter ruber TaxID=2698458 RepID=A0A6P1NYR4_9BACT|nr:hypothetical protein [Nibribacter ruber]QHL87554.1 hypothetical protein GU926_08930 [Nibribacter ruber]